MDNSKFQPLNIAVILILATAYTVNSYFLPEIEEATYDVAASIWFVYSPLYLLLKRLWLLKNLSPLHMKVFDICACSTVFSCLLYTIFLVGPDLKMRVITVSVICVVLWVFIFRETKDVEAETEAEDKADEDSQ